MVGYASAAYRNGRDQELIVLTPCAEILTARALDGWRRDEPPGMGCHEGSRVRPGHGQAGIACQLHIKSRRELCIKAGQ
jgi:hypothetical protein